MGIYDRDYYRKEGPSYLDSFTVRGQMTRWLLIVTISVYVLQLITRVRDPWGRGWLPGPITEWFSLDPERVLHGEVWRLVTYAFLHSDFGRNEYWWHIVFNMWMFFLFAGYVEEIYGRWEFLAFYLTAALVGGLAYLAESLLTGRWAYCVGASAAVTGVLIVCACSYPRLTILLFFVIPTPVWVLATLMVVKDLLGLLGSEGQTAFSGHLGGAVFAFVYFKSQIRILSIGERLRAWRKQRSRPRLRVYHPEEEEIPEPVAVGPKVGAEIDEQFEAKVDAVLAKVARSGQDSLTDVEKQILLKASELYKRRRT